MGSGGTSTTPVSGETGRPTWLVSVIALAILFALSELTYLVIATISKLSIDSGSTAHNGFIGALSNGFFTYGQSHSGTPMLMLKTFFGLPGFNNLFFLLFWPLEAIRPIPFVTSGLAAPLVGMLAVFCHITLTAGRGWVLRVLSALLFSVVWVLVYTAAEASIYEDTFWSLFPQHFLEMPVAFLGLLGVSFVLRRRA